MARALQAAILFPLMRCTPLLRRSPQSPILLADMMHPTSKAPRMSP